MRSPKGGKTRRTTVGATLALLGLTGGLVASSSALAAPDPLAPSSSVVLQLKSSGGLKLKPKTLSVPINEGQLDPTTGAGSIKTKKAFKARQGGRKVKVKITQLIFGANGGPGRIDAKVTKKTTKGFAKLSGGTLTREGFGAKLDGVTAKLGKKGAKALRRALSPGGAKKASASAGGIKGGKRLGTVAVNAVPKTVEVLPGGTLVFESDSAFGLKLLAHCINPLPGEGGVEAIAPATEPVLGEFIFPVTGGSIAPDFSSGRVLSAGGQKITKNINADPPGAFNCSGPPDLGTTVLNTEFEAQFDIKAFASQVTLPTGNIGIGALGPFDLAQATTSADPNTRQVTVSGAPVTMDPISASVFNAVFPTGTGNPNDDFKAGDPLGTMSLTVTTH